MDKLELIAELNKSNDHAIKATKLQALAEEEATGLKLSKFFEVKISSHRTIICTPMDSTCLHSLTRLAKVSSLHHGAHTQYEQPCRNLFSGTILLKLETIRDKKGAALV